MFKISRISPSDLDNRQVAIGILKSVPGSTRLIPLLADLRLVQLSEAHTFLLLAQLLPPLVLFRRTKPYLPSIRSSREYRIHQAKTSTPLFRIDHIQPQRRRDLRSDRSNWFLANCTSRFPHPLVQFSSLLDNWYSYRSSTSSSHPTIAPTSTSILIRRCRIVPSHDRIYLWFIRTCDVGLKYSL